MAISGLRIHLFSAKHPEKSDFLIIAPGSKAPCFAARLTLSPVRIWHDRNMISSDHKCRDLHNLIGNEISLQHHSSGYAFLPTLP
jgi:hypothetical protein